MRNNLSVFFRFSALAITAGAFVSGQSVAQGSNPTVSDGNQNTAVGSSAISSCFNTTNCFYNTATGYQALLSNESGRSNTGLGTYVLKANTSGNENTGIGEQSLYMNVTGSENTGVGALALSNNSDGIYNTAVGAHAIESSINGSNNTAIGYYGLASLAPSTPGATDDGHDNTATGFAALRATSTGAYNTANGSGALYNNTIGGNNDATGYEAMYNNTIGYGNTADGRWALYANTTGFRNSAIGVNALLNNITGSGNIAIGFSAGQNLSSGSNNIDIGSEGVSGDASAIRIGDPATQTQAYIAGIYSATVTGVPVIVDSSGQLGVQTSSARYKQNIASMDDGSSGLMRLRPVTFRYKQEPDLKQYGLIAEQVAQVYPELVVKDQQGQIQAIRYQELTPMLLNEVQKQQAEIETLKQELAKLEAEVRSEKIADR
jgi:hypothetical protein